jgi:PPOX class probable F420-dependent enzyme
MPSRRAVKDGIAGSGRIEAARVARLGTLGKDGRIHLVPICFALDGDRLYTATDAKPKRSRALARLANVRANPEVCVLIDHWDEDWSALWWVRLRGRASVLESGPQHERAIALLRAKYSQYAHDPLGPVIAVEVEERRAWSAKEIRAAPARPDAT